MGWTVGNSALAGTAIRQRWITQEIGRELTSAMLRHLRSDNPKVSVAAGRVLAQLRLGDLREEANGVQERQGDAANAVSAMRLALSSGAGRDALAALTVATSCPNSLPDVTLAAAAPALAPLAGGAPPVSCPGRGPEGGAQPPLPKISPQDSPASMTPAVPLVEAASASGADLPQGRQTLTIYVDHRVDSASAGQEGSAGTGLHRHPHERRKIVPGSKRRKK